MNAINKQPTEWIAVKHLSVVWVQSQRPYDEKWARHIADNFDPDKFDDIVVTKPNGQGIYHIIEGQHRRHALEMWAARMNATGKGDNEQAPCRVVAEADPARAAEIWLGINQGRKRIQPVAEFKVAVVANREPEKTINRIVRSEGYQVEHRRSENSISAVRALKTVYNRHGDITLRNTLETLRAIWGSDPQAVEGALLCGFGIFLHEFAGHVVQSRLKRQVGDRFSPWKLLEAARVRKESTRERLDEVISELLMREYNRNMKEGAKLKHKT